MISKSISLWTMDMDQITCSCYVRTTSLKCSILPHCCTVYSTQKYVLLLDIEKKHLVYNWQLILIKGKNFYDQKELTVHHQKLTTAQIAVTFLLTDVLMLPSSLASFFVASENFTKSKQPSQTSCNYSNAITDVHCSKSDLTYCHILTLKERKMLLTINYKKTQEEVSCIRES